MSDSTDLPSRLDALMGLIYLDLPAKDYPNLVAWAINEGCTDDEVVSVLTHLPRWGAILAKLVQSQALSPADGATA